MPLRVLIVDDEPFNVNGLKIIVQCLMAKVKSFNMNKQVDVARNGIQACQVFKDKSDLGYQYGIILMDCNMPKMDGYDAAQEIIRHAKENSLPKPYIVALTGHVEDKYIQRALDSGMESYIKKPAQLEDLKPLF